MTRAHERTVRTLRLLAISGSLREKSYNSLAIRAAARLAPDHIQVDVFDAVGNLPLFNPDLEDSPPLVVKQLKQQVATADGLIIASPEYAHGISGVIKNTLDWLVSGEGFINIPIALINTSPRASHAQLALREVLKTMSGQVVEAASIPLPLLGTTFDEAGLIANRELREILVRLLEDFETGIAELQGRGLQRWQDRDDDE